MACHTGWATAIGARPATHYAQHPAGLPLPARELLYGGGTAGVRLAGQLAQPCGAQLLVGLAHLLLTAGQALPDLGPGLRLPLGHGLAEKLASACAVGIPEAPTPWESSRWSSVRGNQCVPSASRTGTATVSVRSAPFLPVGAATTNRHPGSWAGMSM
ncbi:hypothetical protein ACWCXB_32555 [Streptomyces sp. NPDC001514]